MNRSWPIAIHVLDLLGRDELQALQKHARHVRVALEAALVDQPEQLLHLLLVVDVLGEHVLVHRVPRRAVHVQPRVVAMDPRQRAEEVPAAVDLVAVAVGVFELLAGPEDRPLGAAVEPFGVEHGALVVIAQQARPCTCAITRSRHSHGLGP